MYYYLNLEKVFGAAFLKPTLIHCSPIYKQSSLLIVEKKVFLKSTLIHCSVFYKQSSLLVEKIRGKEIKLPKGVNKHMFIV